jgi:hypothetical protein
MRQIIFPEASKKEDLVQAPGLSFTVSTVALATGLARESEFAIDDIARSLLAARRCPGPARYVDRSTHTWPHQPCNLPPMVLYLHTGARSSTAVAAFYLSVALQAFHRFRTPGRSDTMLSILLETLGALAVLASLAINIRALFDRRR